MIQSFSKNFAQTVCSLIKFFFAFSLNPLGWWKYILSLCHKFLVRANECIWVQNGKILSNLNQIILNTQLRSSNILDIFTHHWIDQNSQSVNRLFQLFNYNELLSKSLIGKSKVKFWANKIWNVLGNDLRVEVSFTPSFTCNSLWSASTVEFYENIERFFRSLICKRYCGLLDVLGGLRDFVAKSKWLDVF